MLRLAAFALLAVFAAARAFAAVPGAASAATCSLMVLEEPAQLVRSAAETDLIFVATVTSEMMSGEPYPGEKVYDSTVRPLEVLKGEPPEIMTFPNLNQIDIGCQGGPRLREGESVLILARLMPTALRDGVPEDFVWSLEPVVGKVLLEDGKAEIEPWHGRPLPLGSAEDAIRLVAAPAGATEEQVDAAILAADGEARAASYEYVYVGVALAVLGAALLALRLQRSP